jgi:hypothetical protein
MVQYFDRGIPGAFRKIREKRTQLLWGTLLSFYTQEKFKRNLNPLCVVVLQFLLQTAPATLAVRSDLLLIGEMVELESHGMNMFEKRPISFHRLGWNWMWP